MGHELSGHTRPFGVSRWLRWLSPVALLLGSWVWIVALTLQARPGTDVVAVVFPPWWSAQRSISAAASAGGAIVRTGGLASVVVVQSTGADSLQRLRDAGAWFAIDPQAVDACLTN